MTKIGWPARPGRGGVLFLTLVVSWLTPVALFAATFTASLDRDTVTVGESATLSLVFQGGSPKTQPQLPGIQDLRVGYGGSSKQISWVNGDSTSSDTFMFSLTPTQPGDYTIPPLEFTVGGETLRSPQMVLKAVRAAAVTPDTAGADQQLALLKIILPKRQIYLGEVMQAEMDLYLRDTVLGVQGSQFSQFAADGISFSKTVQGQQHVVRVGNANFTLVPLFFTMTAVKSGDIKIDPVDCTLVVQLPSAGTRQRDPFDPFGMFQHNEARRITISSEAESIEVLALPDNAPAGFTGAVGNYNFALTAAPTTVTAGDPVTVKIQVNGRGALDAVTLPDVSGWHDFKSYPPTAKVQTTDQLGIQGAKNFEVIVVPQNTDVHELPAVAFSFFDPDARSYRTITQPAIALTVRPGAASAQPVIAAAGAKTPAAPAQELVPIKLRLGTVAKISAPLLQRPGFWALQSIPVLAWAGLVVRRKRAESLANNPRLRRQLAVAGIVASGLEDLRRLAAKNDSDNFFATLFRLLQEQLGERLDLPATAITEAVIEEQLRPRLRVPEPALGRLQELFQACNLARYAPVKSSHELEAFIPRLETTLRELQSLKS